MKVHDLKPAEGSTHRRKHKARGIAGKAGKTAGRGTKGQKARGTIPARFEGGQLPLQIRLPKLRGFKNPFRVEYQGINLDSIIEAKLTDVSPESLREAGLAHKGALIKVLGRGGPRQQGTHGQGSRRFQERRRSDHQRRRHRRIGPASVQRAPCLFRQPAHEPLISLRGPFRSPSGLSPVFSLAGARFTATALRVARGRQSPLAAIVRSEPK